LIDDTTIWHCHLLAAEELGRRPMPSLIDDWIQITPEEAGLEATSTNPPDISL
jgi:hypothetical protein